MKTKILLAPALALSAVPLGACAHNYAVEGAAVGAAAGAGVAAATGGNVAQGAGIGALIKKDGHCYRRDRNGNEYRVDCPR